MYGVYETAMHQWSSPDAPSQRLDLLLILPIVYAATIAGVASWWQRSRRRYKRYKRKPAGSQGPAG